LYLRFGADAATLDYDILADLDSDVHEIVAVIIVSMTKE